MIIILEPEKDTYVTNLKTPNNDGSKSNVGHAATLDLFKLYNENKNQKSWAAFKFTGEILDGRTLVLTDSNNTSKTFEFDTDNSIVNGNIRVNISGQDVSSYAAILKAEINAVLNFEINADSNSSNELILKQNKTGASGDTTFTVPDNMVHIGTTEENVITKFARIDYSAALIKFNLNDFKSSWITLINDEDNDGIDEAGGIKDDLPGAFRNLKAELILKDVTTGTTKPKDYKLKAYKLLKDFEEGVGKDTVHFSDKHVTNFNNFSSSVEWDVFDFVSDSDAVDLSSSFDVVKGSEDLKFDITNYIKSELVKDNLDDKGFLIKFDDLNVYNNKTYFAKRLGSRHLINKKLSPELRIKINDSGYNIPVDSFNKKRFLNNLEEFYLFNNTNGSFSSFVVPTGNYSLKLKIKSKDNKQVFCVKVANSTSADPIVNFKGNILEGIRKASLTTTDLSKFNSEVADRIINNKLEANYEWVWNDDSDETKTVTAGSFIVGRKYKIKTIGTTNFSLIGGDSSPVVGETFFASGIGSGDGDAYEVEKSIVSQRVDFYTSENANEEKYENLISSIKINENKIIANNSTCSVEVYFVDTKKEFNAVKVPFNLPSENLGNVFYQLYDIESGDVLLDYNDNTSVNATKMFFDGEKYIFNLFVPAKYKNSRVNFNFKFVDATLNVDKYVSNKKYSIKVI